MHGTILMPAANMRWTEAEDEVIRDLNPDHASIRRLLPHRTHAAIKARIRAIGAVVRKTEKPLTAREEKRIKQLAECFSSSATIALIMGRNIQTVQKAMSRRGWHVKKPAPTKTGNELYDAVRDRAFEMGIGLRDLDRGLGYRSRFFSQPNRADKGSIGMIAKAVMALGGRLVIEWESLNGDEDNG